MRTKLLLSVLLLFLGSFSFLSNAVSYPSLYSYHMSISDLFSYPNETFRAGTKRILTPVLHKEGGVFSYRRISSGIGALGINLKDGRIDLAISQSGTYELTYVLPSGLSQSLIITIQ
jgi:hypothetical protein